MAMPLLPGRLFAFMAGAISAACLLASTSLSASLSVQISPAGTIYLNAGSPALLTTEVSVSAAGGVTPYVYNWTRTTGSNSSVSDPASSGPAIGAIVNWGDNFTETWTVTITGANGATGSDSVAVNFESPSADGVPDAANRVPIKGPITPYLLTTALPVGQTTYPIQVYVPADYSSTSDPLPVIYATDAGPFNHALVSVTWEFSDLVRIIEAQHLRIIVVGIGGGETRNVDYLLPGADSFYTFITTELIQFVESRYDIDPTCRTLSGHSYGGMFSGFVFMKERPGTRFFANYISLDGSFWVNPSENLTMEQALYTATIGTLPGTALVVSSSIQGNDGWVTQFYQQVAALNFHGLQLNRIPDFNTGHLLMYDEAFAASLQLISPNLPGAFTVPAITTQPTGASVTTGGALNLQVTAVGGGLVYQWLKDGTALAGATGASYSVPSATSANAGTYTVIVKNRAGSISTNPATVTVAMPTPTPTPTPASGGGGGGGGALSPGFLAALAILACGRWARRTVPLHPK